MDGYLVFRFVGVVLFSLLFFVVGWINLRTPYGNGLTAEEVNKRKALGFKFIIGGVMAIITVIIMTKLALSDNPVLSMIGHGGVRVRWGYGW